MTNHLKLALPAALLLATLSGCGSGGGTDTTRPTVQLTGVASSVTQAVPVTFQATASDNKGVRAVAFYVDSELVQQVTAPTNGVYQTTYTWQATQNGAHTVRAVATDTSNNQSAAATQPVTVNLETVKPTVNITANAPDPVTVAGSYTLAVSATDNVGVVSMAGEATCTDTSGKTSTLIQPSTTTKTSFEYAIPVTATYNGTCTLRVSATDAAGNVGTASRTITIAIPTGMAPPPLSPTPGGDTVPPVVSIRVDAPNPVKVAGSYRVTVSATDNVGVTSLSGLLTLPSGQSVPLPLDASGGSQDIVISALYNGTSTLAVTATDAAGNQATQTRQIVVDIQ